MKEQLDTGKGKIQKICDLLKHETIEPAKQQAKEMIENAEMQAKEIVENAQKESARILKQAEDENQQQKKVFESSLVIAGKQVIGQLKQEIEKTFFTEELQKLVAEGSTDPKLIQNLIETIMKAIEKNGIEGDLSAFIPKEIPPRKINEQLVEKIKEKLTNQSVELGEFSGGVQVKIHEKQLTIDLSDESLKQLIANYIRKDFRSLVFKA